MSRVSILRAHDTSSIWIWICGIGVESFVRPLIVRHGGVEPRHLVRVDKGKHLGKPLPHLCNSLGRISEWQLAPRKEFHSLTIHIDHIFSTRCAGRAAEWLLSEHGVVLVVLAHLAHEDIVHILKVLLQQLHCLLSVLFISELLRQSFDDFIESIQQALLKGFDSLDVCLLI